MRSTITMSLLLATILISFACKEDEPVPSAWGEECEPGKYPSGHPLAAEGGCDVGLKCWDWITSPIGRASEGICVSACDRDEDCASDSGQEWVCESFADGGKCVVPCSSNAECPSDLAKPMFCWDQLEFCVIRRESDQ